MSTMRNIIHTDILIIGGGPAGSSACIEASKAGLNTVVVERKTKIGEPVRCAGYIPSLLLNEFVIKGEFIIQSVESMVSILPDGSKHSLRAPGYLIDRSIFDRALYEMAISHGGQYLLGTRAIGLEDGMVKVKDPNGRTSWIRPKVIIGADGPHSKASSWIGIKLSDMVVAIQAKVTLLQPLNHTLIFLKEEYFGGYGWLFPRGQEANVGIGIKKSQVINRDIHMLLHELIQEIKKQGIIEDDPKNITAGWIPVKPSLNFVSKNIMLVGDAAGHTHPITGAGIYQAVSGGRIAGLVASKAIKEKNMNLLKEYQREFTDIFYDSLMKARNKRELMESNWDMLNDVIRRCWVGFREYYMEP